MPGRQNREGCLKGSQTLWDAHREQKEENMLLLARKAGQSVVIDGNIRVTVDRIRGRVVRLKVEAPREIRVDREEVWNRRASEIQPDRASLTNHSTAGLKPR
jgi:carbon storage regulator